MLSAKSSVLLLHAGFVISRFSVNQVSFFGGGSVLATVTNAAHVLLIVSDKALQLLLRGYFSLERSCWNSRCSKTKQSQKKKKRKKFGETATSGYAHNVLWKQMTGIIMRKLLRLNKGSCGNSPDPFHSAKWSHPNSGRGVRAEMCVRGKCQWSPVSGCD